MVEIRNTIRTNKGQFISIRTAVGSDAKKIIDCINKVGAEKKYIVIERFSHDEEWERNHIESINPNYTLYLVAELNQEIIGIISIERETYRKSYHTATLGMIIIKEYRNVGIGSALIQEGLKWAKSKKIEKVCLSCFSTNKAAIALYKKFNFKEEGKRKKQFKVDNEYVDEVMMARWI